MNVDSVIFWNTKNPDFLAGQQATAKVAMGREFNQVFTKINGSIPVRTDIDLSDQAYQSCQRNAADNLKAALAADNVVLSLGHNMAQTNEVTAALRDVITEFMHNPSITPEQAQTGWPTRRTASADLLRARLIDPVAKAVAGFFLAVAVAYVVGFTLWTLCISFTGSTLLPEYSFVGLRNYQRLFNTRIFQIANVNLVIYGVGFVTVRGLTAGAVK